jgi:hypothetical protein
MNHSIPGTATAPRPAAKIRRAPRQQAELAIYQTKSGEILVTLDQDSIWLSIDQMGELFERDKSVICRHMNNIFKEGELQRDSVAAKKATIAADGKRYQVNYFNLDLILAVAYRVKSPTGVKFRQWATRLLSEHLTQGYTVNQQRFAQIFGEVV